MKLKDEPTWRFGRVFQRPDQYRSAPARWFVPRRYWAQSARSNLIQRILNACEGRIELGTQPLDHGDDGHRYTSGDQAVLNRCSAFFIFQKLCNKAHVSSRGLM